MDTFSPTIEQLRRMDPEQIRKLAREAAEVGAGYRESDPDTAAKWHNLSAGLHSLAHWIEQSS